MSDNAEHGNSKYKPEYAEIAGKLCLKMAATDRQLASYFGVNYVTLQRWKHEHDDFRNSLKLNKELADEEVVKTLFQRAIGYDTVTKSIGGDGAQLEETKHYPPDPTSMIFWLKNRQPKVWRDKPELAQEMGEFITALKREIIDNGTQSKDPT